MAPIDVLSFLKTRVPLFKDFPEDRLTKLVAASQVTTFEPNEAIIEIGKEGRFFGIVLDGEAEASIIDDSGEKHGEIFS